MEQESNDVILVLWDVTTQTKIYSLQTMPPKDVSVPVYGENK